MHVYRAEIFKDFFCVYLLLWEKKVSFHVIMIIPLPLFFPLSSFSLPLSLLCLSLSLSPPFLSPLSFILSSSLIVCFSLSLFLFFLLSLSHTFSWHPCLSSTLLIWPIMLYSLQPFSIPSSYCLKYVVFIRMCRMSLLKLAQLFKLLLTSTGLTP